MYNIVVDTLIWTFAMYGFVVFMQEYFVDAICYIVEKCMCVCKLFMRIIDRRK